MRAFVAEVDHAGLRRFIPEDLIPPDELGLLARRPARPTMLVWALLDDADAEDLRADLDAGRHGEACGLLLNRATELLPIAAAVPAPVATIPAAR